MSQAWEREKRGRNVTEYSSCLGSCMLWNETAFILMNILKELSMDILKVYQADFKEVVLARPIEVSPHIALCHLFKRCILHHNHSHLHERK